MNKVAIWLIAMIMTVPTWAQGPDGPGKEKRKLVRTQVKAYMEQNVLPVLVENRLDFEDILTASERETIADLRQRQQALKEQMKTHRQEMKAKRQAGQDYEPTEAERNARRLARKEMRLIATATFEIIDEHEDFFMAMESDLKDDKETWDNDIKGIMQAAFGDAGVRGNGEQLGRRQGQGRRGEAGPGHAG